MKYLPLLLGLVFFTSSFKADMLTDCQADGSTYYSIEEALGDVDNAARLDIAMNKLKTIDPKIGQLKNLQCLDLSFNIFSTLPKEMAQLEKLSYLNLAGTRYMSDLPSVVYELKGLKLLDLQDHPEWSKAKKQAITDKLKGVRIIWNADNSTPSEVND